MEQELLEADQVERVLAPPYVGLKGKALVGQVLESGPKCLLNLGSSQVRYFGAICVRKGIKWPEEFFESTVEELMDRS